MRKIILATVILVLLASNKIAEPSEMKLILKLPPGYQNNDQKFPLLVYLHGSGVIGNSEMLREQIAPIVSKQEKYPFVLLAPLADDSNWVAFNKAVIQQLDEVIQTHRIDQNRIYLTGFSMGGKGTWEIAVKNPTRFAALLVVSGGPREDKNWENGTKKGLPSLNATRVWVFHGEQDQVVPLEKVMGMVEEFQKCGGQVKLSIIPKAGHDISYIYKNDEVYEWLLQQRRTNP
jgi:predicted peptidase